MQFFFLRIRRPPRSTLFPYRRSSDLPCAGAANPRAGRRIPTARRPWSAGGGYTAPRPGDRKSTRLNSSHVEISYAVFCLKKKIDAELLGVLGIQALHSTQTSGP